MTVSVAHRPDPWSVKRAAHVMPDGLTLAEIVARYPEPLPEDFAEFGVVLVNGEYIPREWWGRVRPRVTDAPVVVSLHGMPRGGGGGGGGNRNKQIAQILGTVALVAATAWIGGGALAPFLGAGFAAGTFGAAAASAAIGVAGSLALRAMAPPPQSASGSDRPTVSVGVGVNTIAPLAGIPTVVGKMLLSPPSLIPPYTTFENDTLYSHTIVGLAGRHAIANIKINAAPVADLLNVEVQTRKGTASDTALTLNAGTILEEPLMQDISEFEWEKDNLLVPNANIKKSFPEWHTFRTRGTAEEFRIRFHWPQGLFYRDSADDLDGVRLQFRIQIRLVGTTPWLTLPTVAFMRKTTEESRQEIRLKWVTQADPVIYETTTLNGWQKRALAEALNSANSATVFFDEPVYNAHTIFKSAVAVPNDSAFKTLYVTINRDSIMVLLKTDTFPLGQYEVRIKQGLPIMNGSAYMADRAFTAYGGPKWTTVYNPENFTSAGRIESVTTFRNQYPLGRTTDLTLIAVRSKNLAINSINAEFTKECPVYFGGNWNTIAATQNPANLFRHILLDNLNAEPLDAAIVDLPNIQTWHAHCAANGLTCNAVVESKSVEQALMLVAAAGHAAVRHSDKWGVIIEKSRAADAVVQVFSPRNTTNNSIVKTFEKPVHALRVSYFDSADQWKLKEVVIYDDGFSAANATNIESVTYDGKTNLAEVTKRARLDLRQLRLRPVRYSFDTDSQFLVSLRGDLVAYTHDVLDKNTDAAWVKSSEYSGFNLVALYLDASIFLSLPDSVPWLNDLAWSEANLWGAGTYAGIVLRQTNGTITTHRITQATTSSKVALYTPTAIPVADVTGALVVGGILGRTTRRCVVFNIEPRDDLTARVTLLDEAPAMHSVV